MTLFIKYGFSINILLKMTLCVISMILLISCKSQRELFIKKQNKFSYSNQMFVDSLDVDKPNFKFIDIEIRVWYNVLSTGEYTLVQLNNDKYGKWKGLRTVFNYYSPSSYNFRYERCSL